MITLTSALVLAGILSAAVRLKCHKGVAFGVGVAPAFLVFIYFVIRYDVAIGHGMVPMWLVAGVILVLSAIVSAITALVVPGRNSAA